MTVREAFEKAGYPVPNKKRGEGPVGLYRHANYWIAVTSAKDGTPIVSRFVEAWLPWAPCMFGELSCVEINLSNLPAKDCWDALPSPIRKAQGDDVRGEKE